MSSFIIYTRDAASDTFKNLHAVVSSEQDARNTATGLDALVFKNGQRWKYFDNHGASFSITEE
ncbi:hypothetical protein ACM41_16575 [Bradyrhizobium sp. CCBAU 21362]|uniref:hypothetical protein n=1 Tax=Bradyrhizobium sp. CCBAU 21362 TaxID=1325082 RepID=UPI0023061633|nr:hypothetical protein [Bradyrhizobium sp. CCBAU 21362]MDA9537747.1 hypothetical protein [Bradyrhizobium sp. CCBAU 21362]